jgi:hypothetical protein
MSTHTRGWNGPVELEKWRKRAFKAYDIGVEGGKLRQEYERLLPRLKKIYEALPKSQQEQLEKIDGDFHSGKPQVLVSFAQKHIPGAFKLKEVKPAKISLPRRVQPVDSVNHMSELNKPLYHGTKSLAMVFREGFCVKPAIKINNDTYAWDAEEYRAAAGWDEDDEPGWPIDWGDPAIDWYEGLSAPNKKLFQDQVGRQIKTKYDLGRVISLFWVAGLLSEAQGYTGRMRIEKEEVSSPVLVLDVLKHFNLFGWFSDMEIKGAYVLVLPTDCPQGLPSAIVDVIEHKK